MSEQEQANQGAIPPKVSPISKVEGAAVTPAGAPRPISVRLKPVAAATTPAPSPKATSRVPVPDLAKAKDAVAAPRPVTVRLRPLTPAKPATPAAPVAAPAAPAAPTKAGGSTQTIAQVEFSATAPIAPVAAITPKPEAGETAEPSAAQVQAAKSKTSRITLDAAIGAPALAGDAPKTIRLKRPSDLSAASSPQAAARKTSRIPESALPGGDESAAVTQKKTLKIKRPGLKTAATDESDSGTAQDDVQLMPITSLDLSEPKSSSVFTTIAVICAVAAAVVLLLLTLCLGAHNIGPDASPNALASIRGPELPWMGRL